VPIWVPRHAGRFASFFTRASDGVGFPALRPPQGAEREHDELVELGVLGCRVVPFLPREIAPPTTLFAYLPIPDVVLLNPAAIDGYSSFQRSLPLCNRKVFFRMDELGIARSLIKQHRLQSERMNNQQRQGLSTSLNHVLRCAEYVSESVEALYAYKTKFALAETLLTGAPHFELLCDVAEDPTLTKYEAGKWHAFSKRQNVLWRDLLGPGYRSVSVTFLSRGIAAAVGQALKRAKHKDLKVRQLILQAAASKHFPYMSDRSHQAHLFLV
jgi:hypothetical protein